MKIFLRKNNFYFQLTQNLVLSAGSYRLLQIDFFSLQKQGSIGHPLVTFSFLSFFSVCQELGSSFLSPASWRLPEQPELPALGARLPAIYFCTLPGCRKSSVGLHLRNPVPKQNPKQISSTGKRLCSQKEKMKFLYPVLMPIHS